MTAIPSIFRDPLVHFLLIGAMLFGLYAVLNPEEMQQVGDDKIIIIDDRDVARMAAQFERTWRRPPNASEAEAMISAHIRDEVLFREGLTLSLDQGDTVVRQRIVQKMQFLLNSAVGARAPDDDTLKAYLVENAARYSKGASVGFEQIFLGDKATPDEATNALDRLNAGDSPDTIGQPTLLPATQPPAPERIVDSTFGTGFFAQLPPQEDGGWIGPVRSAYGLHLIRITEYNAAAQPDLAQLRATLERDWQAEKQQEMTEARIEALRAAYRVERTRSGDAE